MPFPWPSAVAVGRLGIERADLQAPVTTKLEENLILTSRTRTIDPRAQVVTVEGDVVATYDVERVTAERIEVHLAKGERWAKATGKVVVTDPDGTLQASNVEFSWNPQHRYARAEDVYLQMTGAKLHARSAYLTPDVWTFTDFTFTTDDLKPPLYSVSGRSLSIYPGRLARIEKPSFYVFGQHVVTWNAERFNLNPQASGVHIPSLELHDNSLGLNWQTGIQIGRTSTLEWHFDSYRGEYPGLGAQATESFVPSTKDVHPIVPRSEYSQRFDYGYFDTILVPTDKAEADYIGQRRSAASAYSIFNAAAIGRGAVGESFSTPGAVVYETSGSAGSMAYLSDSRLESIHVLRGPDIVRSDLEDSLELPKYHLGHDMYTISRIDGGLMDSERTFGWGRLSGGVLYRPISGLTFAAGLMGALEGGKPDFDIDPLQYENGAMFRTDYAVGPRTLSVMSRYDTRRGWFDKEVMATQVMGSFEAFVVYQQYPGNFHVGINLRIDEFLNVLKRREFERPSVASQRGR